MNFFPYDLQELPYVIVAILFSFTIHEFAHAYTAYRLGDSTAAKQGRLTLNPIHHIDPIGTIFILLAGFGWARPVPVNRSNFKHPRLYSILVTAAGPLSNLIAGFLFYTLYVILARNGVLSGDGVQTTLIYGFVSQLISFSALLFVFNLLPFPPLDGYRIIEDLAPRPLRMQMAKYEQYGSFIFLLIIFIPPLSALIIRPIFSFFIPATINSYETIVQLFI